MRSRTPGDAVAGAAPDQHEEERDVEDREDGRGQHAADDRSADGDAAVGAGAGRNRERHHAEDEGEAGHQDRPQADPGGLDRRVDHALALLLGALGELDHQDRVLRGQAHRREQADLQIHVVLQAAQRHREDRADEPERNDQQHRDRDRPAFVKRGEAQEDDEQRHAVEQRRLARRQPLLVRLARPRRR